MSILAGNVLAVNRPLPLNIVSKSVFPLSVQRFLPALRAFLGLAFAAPELGAVLQPSEHRGYPSHGEPIISAHLYGCPPSRILHMRAIKTGACRVFDHTL